jgi:hypothetical protein
MTDVWVLVGIAAVIYYISSLYCLQNGLHCYKDIRTFKAVFIAEQKQGKKMKERTQEK